MTHLNSEELIDAIDAALAPDRQSHLVACEHCRRELAHLSSVLVEARQVKVPEPSPLYWQHFSERVRAAIEVDAAAGHRWSWLRWQILAPVGALLLIALLLGVPTPTPSDDQSARIAPEASRAPDGAEAPDRDSWVMVVDLVGDLDLDTATNAALVTTPGFVDQAVLNLTAEEQQELTRMLKAELTRAKS